MCIADPVGGRSEADVPRRVDLAYPYEVAVLAYPGLGNIKQRISTTDLTPAWLNGIINTAEWYLAIQRTIPLDALTQTAVVLDMLAETRELVESIPSLLAESEHA
jgi:hypothetical protein